MNYELAKQLKEAGFPQEVEYGQAFFTNLDCLGREIEFTEYISDLGSTPRFFEPIGDVKSPTLSELIEVCGENFYALWRSKNDWRASNKIGVFGDQDHTSGSTPEEAVANLWLELNNK